MPFIEYQGRRNLFVHIPKTGGTSIEAWLAENAPLRLYRNGVPQAMKVSVQHLTYTDIRLMLGDDYFDYAFTIVRNPFRRLESEFRMRSDLATEGGLGRVPAFPIWVRSQIEMMQKGVFHRDGHFRPQIDYVSNHTEIFRFEDGIGEIIGKVAPKIGLPLPAETPHEKRALRFDAEQHGEPEWDIPLVNMVRNAYAADFETFGYSREP